MSKARLLKGSRVLGQFWLAGDRCQEGWSVHGIKPPEGVEVPKAPECVCEKKSRFCKAKVQWINLAIEEGRGLLDDPYGIPLMMMASDWDATGLTLKIDLPEIGMVGIGPNGITSMTELAKISQAPESLHSMMNIWKMFPGSRVEEAVFVGAPEPEDTFEKKEEPKEDPSSTRLDGDP